MVSVGLTIPKSPSTDDDMLRRIEDRSTDLDFSGSVVMGPAKKLGRWWESTLLVI